MKLSLSSISAGAMTAAVSLGSSVQAVGASASSALQALPTVAAGGAQAIAQGASSAAAALPSSLPSINAGAASTASLAKDLSFVEKPAKAIAAGIPRSTLLTRTAGFLSKALPVVTIGASALAGARIIDESGPEALLRTKDGRGAVLGAIGGALMLVPHPATQLAAAGVLGTMAANQFGGLDRLDGASAKPAAAAQSPSPAA